MKSSTNLKYTLYEEAVQCPKWHVEHFKKFHYHLTKKIPHHLREDFCGTAKISCEWVKADPKNSAVGLDLDPEPLEYAKTKNILSLGVKERGRVKVLKQNVLKTTTQKFDIIAACNFSFFIFHERERMIDYAKATLKSLKKNGTLMLEIAGGEGMVEKIKESKNFSIKNYGKCRYTWEQLDYDPIQHVSDYAIHFRLPNGQWKKNVFTYHWRLWTIREIREILLEAGFKKTKVFWEAADDKGDGTGDYVPTENGDHSHSWIAYVVGVK